MHEEKNIIAGVRRVKGAMPLWKPPPGEEKLRVGPNFSKLGTTAEKNLGPEANLGVGKRSPPPPPPELGHEAGLDLGDHTPPPSPGRAEGRPGPSGRPWPSGPIAGGDGVGRKVRELVTQAGECRPDRAPGNPSIPPRLLLLEPPRGGVREGGWGAPPREVLE